MFLPLCNIFCEKSFESITKFCIFANKKDAKTSKPVNNNHQGGAKHFPP